MKTTKTSVSPVEEEKPTLNFQQLKKFKQQWKKDDRPSAAKSTNTSIKWASQNMSRDNSVKKLRESVKRLKELENRTKKKIQTIEKIEESKGTGLATTSQRNDRAEFQFPAMKMNMT